MRLIKHSFISFLLARAHAAVVDPRSSSSSTTFDVWATPHDSFSSSIGVLGCKIDTDRVAYWPDQVDCNNICVSLRYQDRQVYLLRIDQSQGAHDISYDAFNHLLTGYSATQRPIASGPVAMQAENVDPSKCASLIHTEDHNLPLSAANSMNFLASCLDDQNGSNWVAENHVLYNILDSLCTLGYDETCKLDWPLANQAICPHTLGVPVVLHGASVYNIEYPSGQRVLASLGPQPQSGTPNTIDSGGGSTATGEENAASSRLAPSVQVVASAALSFLFCHLPFFFSY